MPKRQRRGAVMVEFALCVPILLAFLIGIIDVAWLYNHQLVLTNASREGARLGTIGRTEAEVREGVLTYLTASGYEPLPADGDVTVDVAGALSRVEIESVVPMLFAMSGPDVTLGAVTEMRRE